MIDTVVVSGGNIQEDFALGFLIKCGVQPEAGSGADCQGRNGRSGADCQERGRSGADCQESGRSGADCQERGRSGADCQGRNGRVRIIAADRGLEFLTRCGIRADAAIGDFDSLSGEGKRVLDGLEKNGTKVFRLKPEKDDSDTQAAVSYAAKTGAKEVAVLGGTGTRMDHMMANLGLLALGQRMGIRIVLVDQWNYITLISSGTHLKKKEQFGRYVSFFPLGGAVEGLTLKGFQYALTDYTLTVQDAGLTVSNEIVQEDAEVSFRKGLLLMIMSRD